MYLKTISINPLGLVIFAWEFILNKPRIIHILLPSLEYTAGEWAGLLYPHAFRKTCSAVDSAVSSVKASVQGKAVKLPGWRNRRISERV